MTQFILVRHGEPEWSLNEKYKFRGHGRDLPYLTEKGRLQAKEAASDPRLQNIDLIVSSPYTRALQTAAILSKELQKDIRVEYGLMDWQPDSSYTYDDQQWMLSQWDEYFKYEGKHPEGEKRLWETREAMLSRIHSALDKYTGYSRVAVVTHGEVIRLMTQGEDNSHCSIHVVER